MKRWHGKESDGSIHSSEQEEISRVAIHGLRILGDAQSEQIRFAKIHGAGDVGLPGGPAALMIICSAPAWFLDGNRLAVAPDFAAVLHPIEMDLDGAALPIGRDFEFQAIEAGGVVGLVVSGGREA